MGRSLGRLCGTLAAALLATLPSAVFAQRCAAYRTIREVLADLDGDTIPDLVGQTVAVEGTATVADGTFSSQDRLLCIQDDTGGVFLRGLRGATRVRVGDRLRVQGRLTQHNGREIISNCKVEKIGTRVVVPAAVSCADLRSERFSGRLVTVKGMIAKKTGNRGGTILIIQDDTGQMAVYVARFWPHPPELDRFRRGDTIRVTGIATQYDPVSPFDAFYEIHPRSEDDVRLLGRGWGRRGTGLSASCWAP